VKLKPSANHVSTLILAGNSLQFRKDYTISTMAYLYDVCTNLWDETDYDHRLVTEILKVKITEWLPNATGLKNLHLPIKN